MSADYLPAGSGWLDEPLETCKAGLMLIMSCAAVPLIASRPPGPELKGSRPLPLCRAPACLAVCQLIHTAASELAMSAQWMAASVRPPSRGWAACQACWLSTMLMRPLCPAVPEPILLAGLSEPRPAQLQPEQLLLPLVRCLCHTALADLALLLSHLVVPGITLLLNYIAAVWSCMLSA